MEITSVKTRVEFANGVVIEEGDTATVVISGSGAVIEGIVEKVSPKLMKVRNLETYICEAVYADIADVTKN